MSRELSPVLRVGTTATQGCTDVSFAKHMMQLNAITLYNRDKSLFVTMNYVPIVHCYKVKAFCRLKQFYQG